MSLNRVVSPLLAAFVLLHCLLGQKAVAERLYPVPGRPGLYTDGVSLYFDEAGSGIAKKLFIKTDGDLVYQDGPVGPKALATLQDLYRTARFSSPAQQAVAQRFLKKYPPPTVTPTVTPTPSVTPPTATLQRVDKDRWPRLYTDGKQMFFEQDGGKKVGLTYRKGSTPGTGKLYFDDGTEVPKDSEAAKQMVAMYQARPSKHEMVKDFLDSYVSPTSPLPLPPPFIPSVTPIPPTKTPTATPTPTTTPSTGKPHRVEAKPEEFKSVVKVLIGIYEGGRKVRDTYCSGVVTEHGEVATAKHCFRTTSSRGVLQTRRPIGVQLEPGKPATPITGFDADKGSNDFYFVKFDPAASRSAGITPEPIWPNVPDKTEFAKLDLEMVGFPTQKTEPAKKLVSRGCKFNGKTGELGPKGRPDTPEFDPGYSGVLWDTNCPAWFGSSGGPVFATKGGKRYLVGIVTHSFDFNDDDGKLPEAKQVNDEFGKASVTTNFSPTWSSETIKAKKRDPVSRDTAYRAIDRSGHF